MANRLIDFDAVTPVAGPATRVGAVDLSGVCKSVLLSSEGKHFSGGDTLHAGASRTARSNFVDQAQRLYEILDIAVGIHWGGKHARNVKLLEDFTEARELTPGVEGEEFGGFDQLANGELWNVLFSVTAGSARDLVQDCMQDG